MTINYYRHNAGYRLLLLHDRYLGSIDIELIYMYLRLLTDIQCIVSNFEQPNVTNPGLVKNKNVLVKIHKKNNVVNN